MRASKATYPTNALQNSTWQSGVWLNGATMFVDSAPRVIALKKRKKVDVCLGSSSPAGTAPDDHPLGSGATTWVSHAQTAKY